MTIYLFSNKKQCKMVENLLLIWSQINVANYPESMEMKLCLGASKMAKRTNENIFFILKWTCCVDHRWFSNALVRTIGMSIEHRACTLCSVLTFRMGIGVVMRRFRIVSLQQHFPNSSTVKCDWDLNTKLVAKQNNFQFKFDCFYFLWFIKYKQWESNVFRETKFML